MAPVNINPLVTISSLAKLGIALHLAQMGDPSLLLTLAGSAVDLSSAIEFTKKPNMLNDFQTLLRKSVRSTLDEHEFVFEEDQIDEIIDTIFSVEHLQNYLGDNVIDLLRDNFTAALDKLDYPYQEHDLDIDRVLKLILEKTNTEIHQNPDLAALDTNINVHLLVKMLKEHMQGGHAADRFPKYLTGLEPFQPDDILHREKDIAALTEKLAGDEKMVLISGIGGVGKTLLARAVCEAMDKHFKLIAWLHYNGDLDAQLLKLDLWPQNPDLNSRLAQIKAFLKNIEEPVLIIIDNIEDRPSRETLSTLNSFSPSVRLLLTSRLPRIRGVEAYPLDFLSLGDCVDMFYAAYNRDNDKEHRKVVEKMITSVSRHTLTVELLALSAEGDADALPGVWCKLKDAGFAYSELEVENFHEPDPQTIKEHIRRLYNLAGMDEDKRKILRVFSILPHSSPIPMKIIDWMPCSPNDLKWLVERGWLQQAGGDLYLHQMIQEPVRLQEAPSVEDCRRLMISFSTEDYIPGDMVYTQATTRLALSEALITWLGHGLEDAEFATLLSYTGSFLVDKLADYTKALEHHKKALEIREKVHGSEHPDTAATYDNLAGVYRALGDYPRALENYQKALEIRENLLGSDHPDTATTYNNLARVYRVKGDFPRASAYFQIALEIRENVLDSEHPDTAVTYNNLALVNKAQRNYPRALEYYHQSLEIKEKILGTDHPSTATTYNNLAGVFRAQGDFPRALEYYQKALEIRDKVLGSDHPSTANTYNNLALVFRAQGDFTKALAYYQIALKIKEKVLGSDHPSTATTYNNLAGVYEDQGDYPRALEYYQKALEIKEKVLGSQHHSTATTYHNLAGVYQAQCDFPLALKYYQQALEIKEKVIGADHPDTAATYNNLAGVFRAQGDYPRALEFYYKALEIREKVLGREHPDTATTYNDLAAVYYAQGDYTLALEFFLKSYLVFCSRLCTQHPNTRMVERNLQGAFDQADVSPEPFEVWLQEQLEQHSSEASGLPGDNRN